MAAPEPPTDWHPEAVVQAVLDSSPACWCEYVDIGVGHQKVAENPECPRCTSLGMACAVVSALHKAGMLATPPHTWSLPTPPGPEVTAVYDQIHGKPGRVWHRHATIPDVWETDLGFGRGTIRRSWGELLFRGLLTDATPPGQEA